MLYQGNMVETGPASTVTKTPEHPYTEQLLLAAPVADPVAQERRRAARIRLREIHRERDEQAGAVA